MSINAIDQITYGVTDLAEAQRFFSDWGLHCLESDKTQAAFETLNGAQVILKPETDSALPPAFEQGPTLREIVWGAADDKALNDSLQQLATITSLTNHPDGISRCIDPNGLSVGFRISQRRATTATGAVFNTADRIDRINQPAPIYERATPLTIGHLVVFTDNLNRLENFYCRGLGFQVSDRYPGRGVFLRCQPEGGHHNLFILQLPNGKVGLNHIAFVVRDIHEVFGGGLHMSRCGWQTEIGPGRHPISSAYFWYIKNPCGGSVEYYADEDYLTVDWQPRELQSSSENFAEWAISGGIDGHSRRQCESS